MYVHGAFVGVAVHVPQLIHQLAPRENLSRIGQQLEKQQEFLVRQFLRTAADSAAGMSMLNVESLRRFLESSDMVKFAGVEATPEMADEATDSARGYLKTDATNNEPRTTNHES